MDDGKQQEQGSPPDEDGRGYADCSDVHVSALPYPNSVPQAGGAGRGKPYFMF